MTSNSMHSRSQERERLARAQEKRAMRREKRRRKRHDPADMAEQLAPLVVAPEPEPQAPAPPQPETVPTPQQRLVRHRLAHHP
jgi:hypothetical protein